MKILCIAASGLVIAATGVMAAAPQSEQSAKQEKKICRTEKITGSLTRVRRVCMTQAEWDRLAEGTRDGVDDLIRDANQGAASRNGSFQGPGG